MKIERGAPTMILMNANAYERGSAATATATGFIGKVRAGQRGLYQEPLPGMPGWHILRFGAWDVPVHKSHFVGGALLDRSRYDDEDDR